MFSYEIELYLVVEMDLYVSLSISLTTVFFFHKVMFEVQNYRHNNLLTEKNNLRSPVHR